MGFDTLPQQVLDLVDLIGWERTQSLVNELGGMNLYVPRHAAADHRLAKALGTEALSIFIHHYGGGHLYIPLCTELLRERRRRDVRARVAAGEDPAAVARELQVSLRYVRRALQRGDLDIPDDDNLG